MELVTLQYWALLTSISILTCVLVSTLFVLRLSTSVLGSLKAEYFVAVTQDKRLFGWYGYILLNLLVHTVTNSNRDFHLASTLSTLVWLMIENEYIKFIWKKR